MNGAEYVAEFLDRIAVEKVFLMTGGACAFMIDGIARHPRIDYRCFQHEQAAAMAADAVWRVDRKLGVSMATSGPGATNLLTGIACSYFDSIPSLHITGQVNMSETAAFVGADVRQVGFQETKIVEMARPITKYAVMVETGDELREELAKVVDIALSGRMGPVLIDIPMNVQQEELGAKITHLPAHFPAAKADNEDVTPEVIEKITDFFQTTERPLVLFGAGVGLAGVEDEVGQWLSARDIPFVSSWNAASYFAHGVSGYCGTIGVYGNRGANFILQNCDALLVLGSRLDNRQRSGNAKNFAPAAKVLVLDVDQEELRKYSVDGYQIAPLDFKQLPNVLHDVETGTISLLWLDYVREMKDRYFLDNVSSEIAGLNSLSPYQVVYGMSELIDEDAIVISDTGAAVCWFFQSFFRRAQTIFTAGGHSPMGYSLPAAIGAKMQRPDKQVVCYIGDGGFQLNIQELQTLVEYDLDVKIVVINNFGYGIIKQFQDSYLESRYEATGRGYGQPNFRDVARAYGIDYGRIERIEDLKQELFSEKGTRLIEVILDPNTIINPKLEMGRPINDQFPYLDDDEFDSGNRFVPFERLTKN